MKKETEKYFSAENRIKVRRKQLHMTQEQLAERIGITVNTLKKWEKNDNFKESPMELRLFFRLCNVLEVDTEYLTGEIDTLRKPVADIQAYTGLSEEAIENLHLLLKPSKEEYHNAKLEQVLDYAYFPAARAFLSDFLKDKVLRELLVKFCDGFACKFLANPELADESMLLNGQHSPFVTAGMLGYAVSLSPDEYMDYKAKSAEEDITVVLEALRKNEKYIRLASKVRDRQKGFEYVTE